MKKYVVLGLLSFMLNGAIFAQTPVWAEVTESQVDESRDLDIDGDENVYMTGYFDGTAEFPGIPTFISNGDLYVQKLDSAGNFQWVTLLGAEDDFSAPQDDVRDILVDQSGNSYISGSHVDTNEFWATNIYIVKLDSDGNIEWEHSLGDGAGGEMTFASDGGLLVTGFLIDTTDFDPDINNTVELYPENGSTFLLKLGSDGTFEWVKQYGATANFTGSMTFQEIKTDDAGMIYLSGGFNDTIDIDPGSGVVQFEALEQVMFDRDIYLLKLDQQGDFVWAHHFNSDGVDNIRDMSVVNNHVILQGTITGQLDFDPDPVDEELINGAFGRDGFILGLSLTGEFEWVNMYNATGINLDTDINGNIYSHGWFDEACDFSQTATPNLITPATAGNIYLLTLNSFGELTSVSNYDDQAETSAWFGMRRSEEGNYYLLGNSSGPLFGLLPSVNNMTYVAKLSSVPGQNSLSELIHAKVQLSPNPTADLVSVTADIPIDEIILRDLHGREVMRQMNTTIDLSRYESGVYLVTIVSKNSHFTKRVVKE